MLFMPMMAAAALAAVIASGDRIVAAWASIALTTGATPMA